MRTHSSREFNRLSLQRVSTRREDAAGLSRRTWPKAALTQQAGYGHYEREPASTFSIEQLFVISRVLNRPVEWFLGLDSELTEDEGRALALYRRAVRGGVGEAALRVLGAVAGDEE